MFKWFRCVEIPLEKRTGDSKREESNRGFVASLSFLHLHNILVPDIKRRKVWFSEERMKERRWGLFKDNIYLF
jgi:hypothetical protein